MKSLFGSKKKRGINNNDDDVISSNNKKEPLIESMRSHDDAAAAAAGSSFENISLEASTTTAQEMLQSPPAMRRQSLNNNSNQQQQQEQHPDDEIEFVNLDSTSSRKGASSAASTASNSTAKMSASAQLQASVKQDLMTQHTLAAYKLHHAAPNNNNSNNPLQGEPSRSMDEEYETDSLMRIGSSNTMGTRLEQLRILLARSGLVYFLVFLVTAASMVYGVSDQFGKAWFQRRIDWDQELNVAFIGNAYLFINDIPRLLEVLSTGHVYQNSVLHAGGSLKNLWQTGNGMYELWQTDEAVIEYSMSSGGDDDAAAGNDDDYNTISTYDFGLCSVAQILQGYDEYIGYGNQAGHYKNDGLNPCLVNEYYASIVEAQLEKDPVHWDYVVLADQSKRMAIEKARNDTVNVLTGGYGPLLETSGAVPVIVDTHAFWSDSSNMTGLGDIPTFTALIWDGVEAYVSALKQVLPRKQAPIVAPIGLAYLTVWEENFELWQLLFLDDQIHSSAAGSYLFVHVLYATLFGHMPADDDEQYYTPSQFLFQDSRKILGNQPYYPNSYESDYLRDVARRVVLRGYVPPSLNNARRK